MKKEKIILLQGQIAFKECDIDNTIIAFGKEGNENISKDLDSVREVFLNGLLSCKAELEGKLSPEEADKPLRIIDGGLVN